MPIDEKVMSSLVERYGADKAREVYFAMEAREEATRPRMSDKSARKLYHMHRAVTEREDGEKAKPKAPKRKAV